MFNPTPSFNMLKPNPFMQKGADAKSLFGQKQEGPKEQSFFSEKKPLANPKELLGSFGVDTSKIDSQVNIDIQEAQENKKSKETFQANLNTLMEDNSLDFETAFMETLKIYKQRGYSVDGVDIDQELESLSGKQTQETPVQDVAQEPVVQEEAPSNDFLKRSVGPVLGAIGKAGAVTLDKSRDLVGGAVGNIPGAVSNTAGFLIGKPTDAIIKGLGFKDVPSLEAQFKEDGIATESAIQEALGVDSEGFFTKTGQFGSDVGLLFTPTGAAALAAKFPKAVKDITVLSKAAANMAQNAPKTYKAMKSAAVGAKEAGKFEAVSEGEVSPTTLAIGAAANPLADKVLGAIATKEPDKLLRKIVGLKPSQLRKNGIDNVVADAIIGVEAIKKTGLKAEDRSDILKVLIKREKDIYELPDEGINSILKKAGEKGKIKLSGLTDNILDEVDPIAPGMTKRMSEGTTGRPENFDNVIDYYKDFENVTDFKAISDQRAYIGGALRALKPGSLEHSFLSKLGKRVQTQLDDAVQATVGESVSITKLKREYAAIQNIKESLYAKVAQDMRGRSDGIVGMLGTFAAINQSMVGNVVGGAQTMASLGILNKIRDPNTQIHKLMNVIYKGDNTSIKQVIKDSGIDTAIAGAKVKGANELSNALSDSDINR